MRKIFPLLILCLLCQRAMAQGNVTTVGNNNLTGVNTLTQLEGCQHVNALQSFALALAAVSSPGCIAVDPGTYTVSVNAAIGSTVSLVSQSGGLLSIANAVTLTVSGPIVAPPTQIFTYVGTGVATIGANTPIIYPTWFPGTDIGAQINAAYTAMQASGNMIQIPPSASAYNFSTPIVFATIGKSASLDLNGQTINFTPTGGSTGAITAISEVTNTVTATSALNPGANNFVCVTGYAVPADQYNGCYKVATSSGVNFTYVSGIRGIAGAGAGTATNVGAANIALTADFGAVGGANYPWHVLKNGYFRNNNCVTTGGCANATIGLLVGLNNGGTGQGAAIENVRFEGWGDAEVLNSGVSFSINHLNDWYWRSIMGVYSASAEEKINWYGGGAEFNTHGMMLTTPSSVAINGFEFDSNITMALSSTGGGQITTESVWFENLSGTGCNGYTEHYYNGDTNIQFIGGGMQDDCNANPAADYWVTANGQLHVYGMSISSAGRQAGPGTLFVANVTGEIHVINNTPGTLGQQPTSICPVGSIVSCSQTSLGGATAPLGLFTPGLRLTTSGFAVYNVLPAVGGSANTATFPNAGGTIDLLSATSTTTTQVLHATATAGVGTYSAIATGDLPTAIPIGNIGSAGLSGTAPVAIAATGAISCTTCTNKNSAIVNFNQAAQTQVVVSATEYYITRSDLDMPAAYTTAIAAGTTMFWRVSLTKTAAGTGTFQVLLKKGTNGSTADTSIVTQTIGTQTAVVDNMEMDVELTWTSATAAYWTIIPHQSAASGTGFGLVYPATAAQFSGTIAGQTTTTASDKYGLSLIFTTGTPTFVVNQVKAEAFGVN